MPKDILDYIEKEQEYPPRINILHPKKDSPKISKIKWIIYISIALISITFLNIGTPNYRKPDILVGLSIAYFIVFPLLAFYFNFLLNGLVFILHWFIIIQIKNIRIHTIYSKIYFSTSTSSIFILLLLLLTIHT